MHTRSFKPTPSNCCRKPAVGLLCLTVFLCCKSYSFRYSIHLPYISEAAEAQDFFTYARMFHVRNNHNPEIKKRECGGNEPGPFMLISTPLNGISNQYHYLHDVLTLLYGFDGTIVFPRFSSTRLPLHENEQSHQWRLTTIENHFNVVSIIDRLRSLGFKICIDSRLLSKRRTDRPLVRFNINFERLVRACMNAVGCSGNKINKFLRNRFSNQSFFLMPNIWGAVPIPHTVQICTPMLQLSINISLSISFAPDVVGYGAILLNTLVQIVRSRKATKLNVVHLRIEQDYKTHMNLAHGIKNSDTEKLLKPYKDFFRLRTVEGLYYFAVGKLFPDEKALFSAWANETFGSRWILKENLTVFESWSHLNTEQLAVVEYYVIVNAYSFVGNGASSFSYIASEMRGHLGLTSWLVLPPSDIYYPMLGTRRYIFSKNPSLKLVN